MNVSTNKQCLPLIIGHRGASAQKPENTIPAFDLALELEADGIEFDVRLASDGVPVVIHDPDLKRTGRQTGLVRKSSSAELEKIDAGTWFNLKHPTLADPENANARIPRLTYVFERFRKSEALLYVELKCATEEIDAIAESVAELVDRFSLRERVIVESFELASVRRIKQLDGGIKTAALFEPQFSFDLLSTQRIIALAVEAMADQIALHHSMVTGPRVRKASDAGLETVVWTVDKPRWVRRARDIGVKTLITNVPATLVETRRMLDQTLSNSNISG